MEHQNAVIWQVILNPHAGCGKGLRDRNKIINALNKSGLSYQFWISEFPGHTIEITERLSKQGEQHFIIAGGDGSLNEAVNGIFKGNSSNWEKFVLGVIPVGTGNDWIRTFGIPDNYIEALDSIKAGKTVLQDVGEIVNNSALDDKRYFVNIAGFGFDALVAGRANYLKNKGISGFRVYIQSFLWSYLNFNSGDTLIQFDDSQIRVNLFSTCVGIGRYNGGGMMQVPDANPLEGLFHITVIRKMNIWGIFRNFKGLYNGRFVRDKRVSVHTSKVVRIRGIEPIQCEIDGESLPKGSYTMQNISHGLRVIYGHLACFEGEKRQNNSKIEVA
jgi:YegS/Rv2252/BmrU family lipid kinase